MTMFNEYFTGNCSISLENVKYEKINEFVINHHMFRKIHIYILFKLELHWRRISY